jgi:hypothetical protein
MMLMIKMAVRKLGTYNRGYLPNPEGYCSWTEGANNISCHYFLLMDLPWLPSTLRIMSQSFVASKSFGSCSFSLVDATLCIFLCYTHTFFCAKDWLLGKWSTTELHPQPATNFIEHFLCARHMDNSTSHHNCPGETAILPSFYRPEHQGRPHPLSGKNGPHQQTEKVNWDSSSRAPTKQVGDPELKPQYCEK